MLDHVHAFTLSPGRLLMIAALGVALGNSTAPAQELDMINRPVNGQGLTGILATTSPYTLPPGIFEVGLAAISEQSAQPDFSLNQIPAITLSYGSSPSTEISFKSSYIHTSLGQETKQRGAGDAEFSLKWVFAAPKEVSSVPGASLFITGMLPLSKKSETALGGVDHWGTKLGLSIGREVLWGDGDHVIAVFADAQIIVRDLADERVRDRYSSSNMGILLPVSKNRNLQILAEYSLTSGVDRSTNEISDTIDHTAMTYGLRLVTEKLNITIATQFLRKHEEGFDNASRVIAETSLKF